MGVINMNVKFNIKGVIYGAIILVLIIGGFVVIPNMFMEDSKPVDYTMIQREAIPEKILDMMEKYTNEERALAVKLDKKIYVVVTRGSNNEHGIEMDKIDMVQDEEKKVMKVKVSYKEKEKSYPYIVVETNLSELPDRIELNAANEDQ
jgi:ABC-type Na+ efflux pump permease subunit